MIWIIAVVGLLILSVAIRFVFQESRRIQVLDRRLTGVRTWALAAYGEPEQRARRNASNRPLYLILVGALNIASILIPVGAAERAKLRQLLTKAGFRQPDALSVFMAIKLVVTRDGRQPGRFPGGAKRVAEGLYRADCADRSDRRGWSAGCCPRWGCAAWPPAGSPIWPRPCPTRST